VKIGITGLPQSGKTTVFDILTGRHEQPGAFKAETSVAVVQVPDQRLDRIWEDYKPPKKVYPSLEFYDFPATMKETEVFAALRETDLLLVVLRAFESESVPYGRPALDPAADAQEMLARFALADMQLVEKRLERLEKMLRRHSPDSDSQAKEQEVLQRLAPMFEEARSLAAFKMTPQEEKILRNYGLLTLKPVMYVLNAGEEQAQSPPSYHDAVVVFGELEMEICELAEDEQQTYLSEYCITKCAPEVISCSYRTLKVVTFFTTGDKEVRGWTVPEGTTAHEAAGKIHSDMQKGFIKAEVVSYEKFVETGTLKEARASSGRLENRDYMIRDGDIVTIRFSP
jgi:GTP-binding protein YchF